mgnify:CR=1 FL=1
MGIIMVEKDTKNKEKVEGFINRKEMRKFLMENDVHSLDDVEDIISEMEKVILEEMLQGEMDSHLGYSKYDYENKDADNSRNGYSSKEVRGKSGSFRIDVPRDRKSEFEPQVVKKRQKDISKIEDMVLALYQKGLSTRDIQNYIMEIYGYNLSPETISNITDRVIEKATEWQNRPLEEVYPIIFIDGMYFKVKNGIEAETRTAYIIISIDMEGKKDVLGIWIGEVENSKFWLNIFNELKTRGVKDVLIVCTDKLPGIETAVRAVFPRVELQFCIVHQMRNSLKHVVYKDRKEVVGDLKKVYQAATEEMALLELERFEDKWGEKYPYIGKSWRDSWDNLSTFFKYSPQIRRLIYTTNPIESLNSQIRRVTRNKGVYPNEDALFKILYLAAISVTNKWTSKIRDWHLILAELSIQFEDRLGGYL